MKITAWPVIIILVCSTAILADQTQHIAPGEVPEGITVEDCGIVQEAYLKASNTGTGDKFGSSVAISGDTFVIGASGEASNATGINGSQTDNSFGNAGAAYVFVRNGSTWSQQAYLKASNTDDHDRFGASISISGNTIVIGAVGEDSSATGVNGNQADNSLANAGAAYVFVRNGTSWSQQAYLKASNTDQEFEQFGASVAISGNTIVVGAIGEASNATGVNGNESDNSAYHAGAAYVFTRNGTAWSQQAYLKASNTDEGDDFGGSASIYGDTIVIGAIGEDSNATGINGNQADNSANNPGAAYVFIRSGTTWSQQAYLKASNSEGGANAWDYEDSFGQSVAVFGDTIGVGAPHEDSAAIGVNGNQADNTASQAGAAYVFIRNGTTWTQQAYLKASNTDAGDAFGSVAISSDTIVIGAGEDSSSTGVDGNQADNSASYSGAAYVFTRNGETWTQQAYLKASNTEEFDGFTTVAISGGSIAVAAKYEDSNATGINGNQSDNSANSSGAVYAFTGFGAGGNQAIITNCSPVPTGIRLEWIPVSGWDSVVKYSTDLVNTPFANLSTDLPYPVNSYTDTVSNGECFYKVDLEP